MFPRKIELLRASGCLFLKKKEIDYCVITPRQSYNSCDNRRDIHDYFPIKYGGCPPST